MAKSVLDAGVRSRYHELLGVVKESAKSAPVSLKVKGKVSDPWLEELEWLYLNELTDDYQGVNIDDKKGVIYFLFEDEIARRKAIQIIEDRLIDVQLING